ncbi:MAG: hypothetical protein WAM92_06440, partial [Mycobacterium sp.]
HATGLPVKDVRPWGDWELLTEDGSPGGWRRDGELVPGGSLLRPDGTLRQALDAALSSPSGIGIAVDADGKVIGGFLAAEVLDVIEKQRAMSARAKSGQR